jgi:hypothetical protein
LFCLFGCHFWLLYVQVDGDQYFKNLTLQITGCQKVQSGAAQLLAVRVNLPYYVFTANHC